VTPKPKVGFGLAEYDPEIVDDLLACTDLADLVLVMPTIENRVPDFDCVFSEDPCKKLAEMLVGGVVDGVIRGTIDDQRTVDAYVKLTGETPGPEVSLLRMPNGEEFLLSPVSNVDGWSKESRLDSAISMADFARSFGVKPFCGISSGMRSETYGRRKNRPEAHHQSLSRTFEDANWIVDQLQSRSIPAKNIEVDINTAIIGGVNVVVPVNGMVGNQIARIILQCGGDILAVPRTGFSRPYEDNSRSEKKFRNHLLRLLSEIKGKSDKQIS